jgi:excisionase family DNA binding protein
MTRLLTPEDVASLCGYSRKAIYRAIERGELRATKRCSRWRIWPEDLKRWLDEGVPAPMQSLARPQVAGGISIPARRGSFHALLMGDNEPR